MITERNNPVVQILDTGYHCFEYCRMEAGYHELILYVARPECGFQRNLGRQYCSAVCCIAWKKNTKPAPSVLVYQSPMEAPDVEPSEI